MTQLLQFGSRTITAEEIFSLMAGYRMLPALWRELLIDEAIAPLALTSEEEIRAEEQFYKKHQLTTLTERQAWLKGYGMTLEQLKALAMRELKIEKFKIATWGHQLESYFLKYKSQLDKVIYSLIRTSDAGVAQELYFRIQAGEQTFAECATEYSQGSEAQTGGMLGPVNMNVPHPGIAKMLSISQPGQLWPPTRLGEWFVIVKLEKIIPAQLDEPMRQQLLAQLFETWISEQINQIINPRSQSVPVALASR